MLFSLLMGRGVLMDAAEGEPAGGAGGGAPNPDQSRSGKADDQEPKWLPERLKQKEESVLRDLGVKNADEAKALIAAAKAAEDAKKSLEEKYAGATTEITKLQAQTQESSAVISQYADAEMAKLTAEQQAAVKAIAADNKALQLKTIAALSPTWKPAESKSEPEKAAPKVDQSSSSAPDPKSAPAAPASNATTSDADHLAAYENLYKADRMRAAAYLELHFAAITNARAQRK